MEQSIDNDIYAMEMIFISYENHPGYLKVKHTITASKNANKLPLFSQVRSDEVKKIFPPIEPKKNLDENNVLPALLNIACKSLSAPLSKAINNSYIMLFQIKRK